MSNDSSFNPFHQFEIKPIVKIGIAGIDISFSNSALISIICLATIGTLFAVSKITQKGLIPNRMMAAFELLHKVIKDMTVQMIGKHHANLFHQKLIFTLFMTILSMNIAGLMPFSFTVTSHIVVTFFMATIVFFVCVGISILKRGFGFFGMFIPHGAPLLMLPLMFILEIFSYLASPISLGIRLAANMMAGHVMLDVIAYFVILMGVFGVLPFAFLVMLQIFEIGIAILQAYIFSILACVYIGRAKDH